jgi:hypothetical protein
MSLERKTMPNSQSLDTNMLAMGLPHDTQPLSNYDLRKFWQTMGKARTGKQGLLQY